MSPADPIPAAARRHAVLLVWLANIALGTGLGANWLAHVPEVDSVRMWFFALCALVSTVVMLTAVPGALFVGAAQLVRSARWIGGLGILQGAFWTIFQVLLFADTRIYNIFRYHFNGQVINLVYTRGSEDAIHLGWQVWSTVSIGLGLGILLQAWLWKRALRHACRASRSGGRRAWLLRPSLVWCAVLLPAIFLEKSIYAQADLTRDGQVTALARLFPLYARVPMEDLASKVFGVELEKPPRVELEGFDLDYPRAMPTFDEQAPRPNVLVVVVDCLRRDMLTPETTPELHRWARTARRFEDHVSGGNSTRFGIFSMLYGLHGSYWFPFLQAQRGPVLVDALLDLGYEIGVFSSASMNYPELRATAWKRVPDRVYDAFDGKTPWERDVQAADALIDWLGHRTDGDEPFFGFILLDSPHQTYSFPPDAERFRPSAVDLDYLSMTSNEGPEPALLESVRNRYRNAVWHADRTAGRVLAALAEDEALAESTLVVVTGDHGEEFLECGFFGHTSAFTPEQVAVPFLMRGPMVEPGVEAGPTSHLDFAPTLLELLGADPEQRADWTLGQNLFAPVAGRRRVVSGWNELGMWTPHGILRVPLQLLEFDVELYDYRWRLQTDDRAALAAEAESLMRLGQECNRFLLPSATDDLW